MRNIEPLKTDLIHLRIAGEEKSTIRGAARRRGVSVSEFVRTTVLKAAGVALSQGAAVADISQLHPKR